MKTKLLAASFLLYPTLTHATLHNNPFSDDVRISYEDRNGNLVLNGMPIDWNDSQFLQPSEPAQILSNFGDDTIGDDELGTCQTPCQLPLHNDVANYTDIYEEDFAISIEDVYNATWDNGLPKTTNILNHLKEDFQEFAAVALRDAGVISPPIPPAPPIFAIASSTI
jgi:hypothetical protein